MYLLQYVLRPSEFNEVINVVDSKSFIRHRINEP